MTKDKKKADLHASVKLKVCERPTPYLLVESARRGGEPGDAPKPLGPFDLPGGPNTNVSSPLANQVHSMTLCAMQVVRGRRANGSGHGAVHGVALCSPTY